MGEIFQELEFSKNQSNSFSKVKSISGNNFIFTYKQNQLKKKEFFFKNIFFLHLFQRNIF